MTGFWWRNMDRFRLCCLLLLWRFSAAVGESLDQHTVCMVTCLQQCREENKLLTDCECSVDRNPCQFTVNDRNFDRNLSLTANYENAYTIMVAAPQNDTSYAYLLTTRPVGDEQWRFTNYSTRSHFSVALPDICREYEVRVLMVGGAEVAVSPTVHAAGRPQMVMEPNGVIRHPMVYDPQTKMIRARFSWNHPFQFRKQDVQRYKVNVHPLRCLVQNTPIPAPTVEMLEKQAELTIDFPKVFADKSCQMTVFVNAISICGHADLGEQMINVHLKCDQIENFPCQTRRNMRPICSKATDIKVLPERTSCDGGVAPAVVTKMAISWVQPPSGQLPLYYHLRHGVAQGTRIPIPFGTPIVVWRLQTDLHLKVNSTEPSTILENIPNDLPYGVQVCAIYSLDEKKPNFQIAPVHPFRCNRDTADQCSCRLVADDEIPASDPEAPPAVSATVAPTPVRFVNQGNYTATNFTLDYEDRPIANRTVDRQFLATIRWQDPVKMDPIVAAETGYHLRFLRNGTRGCTGIAGHHCCAFMNRNNATKVILPRDNREKIFEVQHLRTIAKCNILVELQTVTPIEAPRTSRVYFPLTVDNVCTLLKCKHKCNEEEAKCGCPPNQVAIQDNCIPLNGPAPRDYHCLKTELVSKGTSATIKWSPAVLQNYPELDRLILHRIESKHPSPLADMLKRTVHELPLKSTNFTIDRLNRKLNHRFQLCAFNTDLMTADNISAFKWMKMAQDQLLESLPAAPIKPALKGKKDKLLRLSLMIVLPISLLIILLTILAVALYLRWPQISDWVQRRQKSSFEPNRTTELRTLNSTSEAAVPNDYVQPTWPTKEQPDYNFRGRSENAETYVRRI